jgi:HPt (histidine-containing phosphotransfer) domain-containing protein
MMPKMNGFEAAGNLRSLGYKKPIIAVTATFLPEEAEKCKSSGIDDLIIKPIKLAEIQRMLEKWLAVEKEPSQEQPMFNAGEMLEIFMNEEEAVLPLLSRFIERTGQQLENFPVLKVSGDWAEARRNAHTIKGAAGTMGGSKLGKVAGVLEQSCIKASVEEAEANYRLVLEAFVKYKKEAEEFILNRRP